MFITKFNIVLRTLSVSYTHLDVYKRQVVGYGRFPLDLPFSSKGRIVDLDTALEIKRGIKGLVHKLLDVLLEMCIRDRPLSVFFGLVT